MDKLKVTWQDGPWNSQDQPIATLLLPGDVNVAHLGEDTLVFRSTGGTPRILLVIPEQRLISAVAVEENGNG